MCGWVLRSSALPPALALSILALVAACESGAATGTPCDGDLDCESGRCGSFYEGGANICLATCSDATDCAQGMVCGTLSDGDGVCVEPCRADTFDRGGFVCVAGAPLACDLAGAAWDCYTCGCGAGEFCDGLWRDLGEPSQCQPLRDVGEPCRTADECSSDHCSVTLSIRPEPPGECWDAPGSACTDETCGSCDAVATGTSCARLCRSDAPCAADERCVREGDLGDPRFYCRALCDSGRDCPLGWTCEAIANTDFATCFPPVTCEVGAGSQCSTCTDLPGAAFDYCAETCIPGLVACPHAWRCTMFGSGDYRCVPPAP